MPLRPFAIALALISNCLFAQTSPDSLAENNKQVEILLQLVNENMSSNVKTAIQHAESAMGLAKSIDNKPGIAKAYYFLGQIYGTRISDFTKAIHYHERSITLAEELQDLDLLAGNYSSAAMIYHRFGFSGKALEQLLTSLDLYRQQEDELSEAFVQAKIALIYSESEKQDYQKLMADFEQILKTATIRKNDSLFIVTASYYTSSLIAHGHVAKAEKFLNTAMAMIQSDERYVDFLYTLYVNAGDIFLQKGIPDAAIEQYEMAGNLSMKYKIRYGEALSTLKLGKVYASTGETGRARSYYDKAFLKFSELGVRIKLIEIYDALADMETKENRFENALRYRAEQLVLKDSLYADQSDMFFAALSQVAREKATIEKKDDHINWLSINLVFIVLLGGCLLGLFYLNHQRLRGARYRSLLVNEKLLLEKELHGKHLEEEALLQKLEFNAKTLTANTLNIIQKNEILVQIREKAEAIRNASPEELALRIKDLLHSVNFGLNTDKNWENFMIHFEQVHNNFFDQLKEKFPHLNSSDLKFCALIKLKLNTKEIATIMNISPQSVKVARSRLRKKLQLGITSNLSSFITQI